MKFNQLVTEVQVYGIEDDESEVTKKENTQN